MKVFFDVFLRLNDRNPERMGSVCAYQDAQGMVVNEAPGVRYLPGDEAVRGCLPKRYRASYRRGSRVYFGTTPYQNGWCAVSLRNYRGRVLGSVWLLPVAVESVTEGV